jgi:hypothetical protein
MVVPLVEGYDANTMQKLCNGEERLILLTPAHFIAHKGGYVGQLILSGGDATGHVLPCGRAFYRCTFWLSQECRARM